MPTPHAYLNKFILWLDVFIHSGLAGSGRNPDFIIFSCGDFGVGFGYNNPREEKKEHKKLSILNDFLNKRNIFLYVVRGNHDNPIFYDGNHNFSNIIFMQIVISNLCKVLQFFFFRLTRRRSNQPSYK